MKQRVNLETLQMRQAKMCKKPTRSESRFMDRLKEHGISFGFQVIISPYIVDFLILKRNLIIEIDGSSHEKRKAYDNCRTLCLEQHGFSVIRVKNCDVLTWPLQIINTYPMAPNRPISDFVGQFYEHGVTPITIRTKPFRRRKNKKKKRGGYSTLLADLHRKWMSI